MQVDFLCGGIKPSTPGKQINSENVQNKLPKLSRNELIDKTKHLQKSEMNQKTLPVDRISFERSTFSFGPGNADQLMPTVPKPEEKQAKAKNSFFIMPKKGRHAFGNCV